MKKLLIFIPILLIMTYFIFPATKKRNNEPIMVSDLSTLISHSDAIKTGSNLNPQSYSEFDDTTFHNMTTSNIEGISQVQIVEDELYAAEFSAEQLSDELATLTKQNETLSVEGSVYKEDLQKNYLDKLTKLRNSISDTRSSESHPQIKSNGLKALDTMIEMIQSYIDNPNDTTYVSLGEKASRYVQKAFSDVDLANTLEIVQYLTSAGSGQTTIGLKLKDAQSIATKFLDNYGYDGSEKGDAYKKIIQQQLATQNVMEIKILEFDELSLEISGLRVQLEEITQ